ncbi:tRNA pseudouridine(38-40) synthase TruA [Rathayibacter soli]|uniref:tRNA pseudouridine(38-40) synthase TruA n=1 Tax=Rathayibacter soli TaxID=3144168 RepID=UPI003907ECD8
MEIGAELAVAPTRIRLDIAYDGSAFSGWSRQPGLRTVQGELEHALATMFRRHAPAPTLVVAGRTDAGVHAAGQVAHVDLTAGQLAALLKPRRGATRQPDAGAALAHRVNGILGAVSDIVVTRGTLASTGFDARFSALWRRYRYRIADRSATHDPLQRHRTLWLPATLDVQAMDEAAHSLPGLHDFAAYCKPREGATTIRTLQEFTWQRDTDGVLIATVKADAFCHSMVRSLVGGCVAVGEGKLAARDLALLREAGDRTSAFTVVPARGLTLMEVGYPDDAQLAQRAEQTRARREMLPRGTL